MTSIWLAGIASLTLCHAAAAIESPNDLPSYNVDKYCQQESYLLGNDNSILKFCLQQEQKSYDELKSKWINLDKKIKDGCEQTPQSVFPSYYKLQVCITRETQAKEDLSEFKFRR